MKLIPESPYFNHVKVGVYDQNGDEWRKRCMIDVEYGESDLEQIKKNLQLGGGCDCDTENAVIEYYRSWMYDLIKRLISSDWTAESGEEEVLEIVREHL